MTTHFTDPEASDETPPFSCEEELLDDGSALVRAAGELDVHSSTEFQQVLDRAIGHRPPRLVVDLSRVTFMDSTALGVLVVLQRGLERPLDVIITRPHLRRVMIITGLDSVFSLHDSLDDVRPAA